MTPQVLKWAIVFAGLTAAYPFGRVLRGHRRLQGLAWTLIGLLPFLGALDIGLVTDATFLGDSHGIEVALIDLLALSLVFVRPLSVRRVPYLAGLSAYLLVAVFSATQAAVPIRAFFYAWKLLRMYLVFFAVVRAAGSIEVTLAILRGMAIGTLYELYLVMQQRLWVYQSPGSFSHQNSLGMALNLFLMVAIALILARRTDWLVTLSPVAGLVAVVLTRSRGTLISFVLGAGLVFVLSALRGAASRKVLIAVLGGVIAMGVMTKAARRITERFETAPAESVETRDQFEKAASMMLRDHPWGLGANHFAWTLENDGYADRVGLRYPNRSAIVHSVYWLTAVEMGYLGLGALVVLLLRPLVEAMRCAFLARPGDVRGDLLLGLGVGLLTCYLHSTVEWIWRATDVSYIFWVLVALVGALARQVRIDASTRSRPGRERERRRKAGLRQKGASEPEVTSGLWETLLELAPISGLPRGLGRSARLELRAS